MTKSFVLIGFAFAAITGTGCGGAIRTADPYRDDVAKTLATKNADVKACYDGVLKGNKTAAGTVTVKFMVEMKTGTFKDIKADGPDQLVSGLSGGNQQKVVMARALSSRPRALVLLSPTAGVDVRSKESLLGTVDEAAARGAGVLVVSDELDDLRVCDRVVVMFRGTVVGEYPRGWSDAELVAAMEGVSGESGR